MNSPTSTPRNTPDRSLARRLANWALKLALSLGLLAATPTAIAFDGQTNDTTVLFLAQINVLQSGYAAFLSNLQTDLKTNLSSRLVFYSENLNLEQFNNADYRRGIMQWLRTKYRGRKLDVIVAENGVSTDFIFKIRSELWPEVPVVFVDIGRTELAELAAQDNVTGVQVDADVQGTLTAAIKLLPDTRHIAFVSSGEHGFSEIYRHDLKEFEKFASNRFDAINLSGLTMDETKQLVAGLPKQTIIFYDGIQLDAAGVVFSVRNALEELSKVSKSPIFSYSEPLVGYGSVGGSCIINATVGAEVADQIGAVVQSGSANPIPTLQSASRKYVFDWQQLQRFDLDENDLPPDSDLRFRPLGLWQAHRQLVIAAAVIFLVQSGLIAALLLRRYYRQKAEAVRLAQNRVLEMIAMNAPLADTLDCLARLVESQSKKMLCSILLLDKDGQHLRHGAAPSLPKAFVDAVNGLAIGPQAGSCGTAIHLKKPVYVRDVLTDPLWENYRPLAVAHNLRACWSTPILSSSGGVLGSFAMYHRRPKKPSASELRLAEIGCHLANIAIEHKQATETIKEERQLLRMSIDLLPEGFYVKDLEHRFLIVNKTFIKRLGKENEAQMLGLSDADLFPAELADGFRTEEKKVFAGEPLINHEQTIVFPDGKKRVLLTTKVPLRDSQGEICGLVGIGRDITEHKQLQEQLRQSQKMEAVGQLAGGVAHDFNNLLTIIQGNVALLQIHKSDDRELAGGLLEIAKATERAANLTRQLLTFSRRQLFQPKLLDLNETVANTSQMLQRLIGENIGLEARYAPGGAPVMADHNMMGQILMNLAVNSRDAMGKGGQLVIQTATVVINELEAKANPKARPGTFIRLSISDAGCGIAPEQIEHIFEPFFTTKEVGKGTGLGLATVFGIVTQHNGWIEVESQVNQGTTFHIYLPRAANQEKASTELPPAPTVRGGKETVLLVEDEAPVRLLIRKVLERQGYRVIEADSSASALQVWQSERYKIDLLITDMVMPGGISGHELAEQLLAEKPGLKVIYNSGYTDDMLGENSPLRDNPNFMEKPFPPHKLLQRVRDCLDGTTGS